jgi:plasmid stability protein
MTAKKTVMVQIRNVPERTHRTLKARAATEGMSLSDYLLTEIERLAAVPSLREFSEMLKQREPVDSRISAADLIREERNSR